MMTSIRILGVIFVLCLAGLGLMYVAGVLTPEALRENAAIIGSGLGVILIAMVALKALAKPGGGGTEPPPTL